MLNAEDALVLITGSEEVSSPRTSWPSSVGQPALKFRLPRPARQWWSATVATPFAKPAVVLEYNPARSAAHEQDNQQKVEDQECHY